MRTSDDQIRVLIVDDHAAVRGGLRALLGGEAFEVVGEGRTGREAVDEAVRLQPDIVLMDVRMPDMDGIAATRLLKVREPGIAVLILTSFGSTDYLREAIEAGAAGYLLKSSVTQALAETIGVVLDGGVVFEPSLLGAILRGPGLTQRDAPAGAREGLARLDNRERATLRLVARGYTNQEIASELHYSLGTIKNSVQSVIEKMHASDRTQAAVRAVQAGLVLEEEGQG